MRRHAFTQSLAITTLCFFGITLGACATSEFTGTTPAKERVNPTSPTKPTNPTNPTNPSYPTNPTNPGYPTNPTGPIPMPTIPTNPGTLPPHVITFQPDNGAVFHIGNGEFEATSCHNRISNLELKGTAFVFEFTVPSNATSVDMQIQDLCGVDYDHLNTATLYRDNTVVAGYTLGQTGLLSALFGGFRTGMMSLPPGNYQLKVESPQNPERSDRDRDDFIVGKVVVYSNMPLVKGRTYAR